MTCKIDVNGIWAGVAGYREEFTPPFLYITLIVSKLSFRIFLQNTQEINRIKFSCLWADCTLPYYIYSENIVL